ncbi:MAG: restriction endonuclease subunit S [Paludibacteraceae bacterium]|nr:restriction endonuclease subunit S [Paludibacteraceae bacterium]
MKDSGIPWIGEIPEGWVLSRIKNCTDIVMGQSPDGDSITSEPVGYLFMQGNTEFSDKYPNPSLYCQNPNKLSRVGDILMSVRAPVGALNISDKIYGIGRGLCSIKNINIDKSYLWYYLLKSSDDFDYYGNGSTFSAITVSSLNNVPLLLPPLAEQHLIAAFLDKKCSEIDSLIDLQEQMIEELKAYKQSVITEAVTKGLNPNVPMKDSGIEWIGDVPEEWEVRKIKSLVDLKSGSNLTTTEISEKEDGFPVYGGNGVRGTYSAYSNDGEYVLIGRQGALCGNINYTKGKFWVTEHALVCYPKEKLVLFWFGESLRAMNLNQYSLSAAQPGLSAERIKNLYIVIPPLAEQQAIADYLDKKCGEIDELITIKQQKIESLKEYKKSVIYEYVTGKREV